MRPAARGRPLLEYITSDWFNKTNRKLNNRVVNSKPVKRHDDFEWVKVYLDEATNKSVNQFDPIMLTNHMFDPPGPHMANRIAKGKIPASTVESTVWGICQGPMCGGQVGKVVVAGITWAKFNRAATHHRYVDIDPDTYVLRSADTGAAQILSFTATSGSDGYGLIFLGEANGDVHYDYLLVTNWLGGIALGRKRDMDMVDLGEIVIVRDPRGIFNFQKTGDGGIMFYQPTNGGYYAVQANCKSSPVIPTEPVGACCYLSKGEWDCFDATAADCSDFGGTWKGEGTSCTVNGCP